MSGPPDSLSPERDSPSPRRGSPSPPAPGGAPSAIPARIWGGLDASLWIKPSFDPNERRPNTRPGDRGTLFTARVPIAGALGLALAYVVSTRVGVVEGLFTLVATFLITLVVLLLLALQPEERPRDVRCSLGAHGFSLRGAGADITVAYDRLASFRVAASPVAGRTIISFRLVEGDLVHVEVPSDSAPLLVETLDSRVPSAVAATGLRPSLSRSGRSIADWRESLRALTGQQGYRGARPPVEALLEAIRDPQLGAEERIGAALALAARPDADSRERLRVAAREAPTPALRVALERVADDAVDEAAILEAVQSEDPKWRIAER